MLGSDSPPLTKPEGGDTVERINDQTYKVTQMLNTRWDDTTISPYVVYLKKIDGTWKLSK